MSSTQPKPFAVEKGVPIPDGNWGKGKTKYPWAKLGVGDSFFVPCSTPSRTQSMRNIAWARGRADGRSYVARIEGGGVRIWRVK